MKQFKNISIILLIILLSLFLYFNLKAIINNRYSKQVDGFSFVDSIEGMSFKYKQNVNSK